MLLIISDKEFDKMFVYNSLPDTFTSSPVDKILKQNCGKYRDSSLPKT